MGSTTKRGVIFSRIEKMPAHYLNQSSLCGLRSSKYVEVVEPDCQVVSMKKAADGERHRCREIIDKGKRTGPRSDARETPGRI